MIASLIIGVISIFATPYGPSAIVGNVLGGLFVEVPLAIMLYRKWTWWAYLVSAAVFGLLNGLIYAAALSALGNVGLIPVGVAISVSPRSLAAGSASCWRTCSTGPASPIDHDA